MMANLNGRPRRRAAVAASPEVKAPDDLGTDFTRGETHGDAPPRPERRRERLAAFPVREARRGLAVEGEVVDLRGN